MSSLFKLNTFISERGKPLNLHSNFEAFHLLFIEKGNFNISINGKFYLCISPSVLCLNEKQSFELNSEDFVIKIVTFLPEFINKNMTLALMKRKDYNNFCSLHDLLKLTPFIKDDFENSYIADFSPDLAFLLSKTLDECDKQLKEKPDWYWSCRSRSYFLDCINIIERLYYQEFGGEDKTYLDFYIPEGLSIMKKALDIIRNDYSKPELNATYIVKKLHTNKNYLNAEFRKLTHKTVYQYILEYRLFQAIRKLKFTALSIEEISYLCGFNSASNFSTIFKNKKGIPPNIYREKAVSRRKNYFNKLELYN